MRSTAIPLARPTLIIAQPAAFAWAAFGTIISTWSGSSPPPSSLWDNRWSEVHDFTKREGNWSHLPYGTDESALLRPPPADAISTISWSPSTPLLARCPTPSAPLGRLRQAPRVPALWGRRTPSVREVADSIMTWCPEEETAGTDDAAQTATAREGAAGGDQLRDKIDKERRQAPAWWQAVSRRDRGGRGGRPQGRHRRGPQLPCWGELSPSHLPRADERVSGRQDPC